MGDRDGRIGDWQQTFTGRQVWPLDLRSEEIALVDIVQALSLICRYGGQIREFYSVAQHSVLVCQALCAEGQSISIQQAGLLHDAAEAFLGDMIRPLKRSGFMHEYLQAEKRAERAIEEKFGLGTLLSEQPPAVKVMDNRVLLTEKRDLLVPPPAPWQETGYVPLAETIWPCGPTEARRQFYAEIDRLQLRRD